MQSTGNVKSSIKECWNGEPQDEKKEIKAILLERRNDAALGQELSLASAFSQQVKRDSHHLSFSLFSLNQVGLNYVSDVVGHPGLTISTASLLFALAFPTSCCACINCLGWKFYPSCFCVCEKIWSRDEDSADQWMKRKLRNSPRRTSFDQRDSIKTIEIDTYGPYSSSVAPLPLPKRMPIQANSSSPRCLRNCSEISTGPVPSYMCSTESARARFRSHSNPRQRASTPEREMMMVPSRKQLSFPAPEPCACANFPSYQDSRKSLSDAAVPRSSLGDWTPLYWVLTDKRRKI